MVETSISRGTLASTRLRSVSRAAFVPPEMRISPSRRGPPRIFSLSRAPLLRRERAHRQGVDFLAHAPAERRLYQLAAPPAPLASEGGRHHQRLEMLPVPDHLHVLAGEPGGDAGLNAFRGNQGKASFSLAACSRTAGVAGSATIRQKNSPRPPPGSPLAESPSGRGSRSESRRSCRRRGWCATGAARTPAGNGSSRTRPTGTGAAE